MSRIPRTDYCAWASREPHCREKPVERGGLCRWHLDLTAWWEQADHEARLDLIDQWGNEGEQKAKEIVGLGADGSTRELAASEARILDRPWASAEPIDR